MPSEGKQFMVKCLAEGHQCHDHESNPHSDDACNVIFERARPISFSKGTSIGESYSLQETFEGAPKAKTRGTWPPRSPPLIPGLTETSSFSFSSFTFLNFQLRFTLLIHPRYLSSVFVCFSCKKLPPRPHPVRLYFVQIVVITCLLLYMQGLKLQIKVKIKTRKLKCG